MVQTQTAAALWQVSVCRDPKADSNPNSNELLGPSRRPTALQHTFKIQNGFSTVPGELLFQPYLFQAYPKPLDSLGKQHSSQAIMPATQTAVFLSDSLLPVNSLSFWTPFLSTLDKTCIMCTSPAQESCVVLVPYCNFAGAITVR